MPVRLRLLLLFLLLLPFAAASPSRGQQTTPQPLRGPLAETPAEQKVALVVGAGSYSRLPKIPAASTDAVLFARFLEDELGFDPARVVLLSDDPAGSKRPTRLQVQVAIRDLLDLADLNTTVVLFFAGHGRREGGEDFFLPEDALSFTNPRANLGISLADVLKKLEEKEARQVLFFGDLTRTDPSAAYERTLTARPNTALFWATSGGGEKSYDFTDQEPARGAFTQFVMEGLRGQALDPEKKREVTVRGLRDFLARQVRQYVGKTYTQRQVPNVTAADLAQTLTSLPPPPVQQEPPPSAPANGRFRVNDRLPLQVTLTWQDNSDNETGFEIERRSGEEPYDRKYQVPADTLSFVDDGVEEERAYTYRVRARGRNGASPFVEIGPVRTPLVLEDPVNVSRDTNQGYVKTLAQALRKVAPNGRIKLYPGRYAENVVIDKPVEILGVGDPESITIQGVKGGDALTIRADDVLIRGVEVRGADPRGAGSAGIKVMNARRVRLVNCKVSSDSFAAVAVHDGDVRLEDSRLVQSDGCGLLLAGRATARAERCEVRDNLLAGIVVRGEATLNALDCQIQRNGREGILFDRKTGAMSYRGSGKGAGVESYEKGSGTLDNCVLRDNGDGEIKRYGSVGVEKRKK